MLEYKLFKTVEYKYSPVVVDVEHAAVFLEGASWAKDNVNNYLLSNNQLNSTFHKSWNKVRTAHIEQLIIEQVLHYLTTYGTNFEGEAFIPSEHLDLPVPTTFTVIKPLKKEDLHEKAVNMVTSGIALAEGTLLDLYSYMKGEKLDLQKIGELSKNKEFTTRLILDGYYTPKDPVDILRVAVASSTGSTLLIKNNKVVDDIKESSYDPTELFNSFGLKELSEIFNRFKPLFLAYKSKCPKIINKISKLSKKNHKPLKENQLNLVTTKMLNGSLDSAPIFHMFRALNACKLYLAGKTANVYNIRNGKVWVKSEEKKINVQVLAYNIIVLETELRKRLKITDKKIFIPEGVVYPLPTSEKKMLGGIPFGTQITGNNLAVGVYWENSGGAYDIDVSSISLDGSKVGWDSAYRSGSLTYSGDITTAPSGAVEYMHVKTGLSDPSLITANIYSGEDDSEYNIIVGAGVSLNRNYMMHTDNLLISIPTKSVSKQNILGCLLPNKDDSVTFVIMNVGSGSLRVAGSSDISINTLKAFKEDTENCATLNDLLSDNLVSTSEEADIDLTPFKLGKDTLLNLFV